MTDLPCHLTHGQCSGRLGKWPTKIDLQGHERPQTQHALSTRNRTSLLLLRCVEENGIDAVPVGFFDSLFLTVHSRDMNYCNSRLARQCFDFRHGVGCQFYVRNLPRKI